MVLINWDASLSVDIIEIDSQHKQLVAMINDLHQAMLEGKSRDVLGKIIINLLGYAKEHFGTEEKYFERYQYPEAEPHKKEHALFVQKVNTFKEDFEQGRIGLSIEVMDFLSQWLKQHIKDVDKRFGPFLKSKGVA